MPILVSPDIIDRLMASSSPPFRPKVDTESGAEVSKDILDIMSGAWAENPDDRPTFKGIRSSLLAMNKGRYENTAVRGNYNKRYHQVFIVLQIFILSSPGISILW